MSASLPSIPPKSDSTRLQKFMLAAPVAGVAAALATGSEAQAQIVYHDIIDKTIPSDATLGNLSPSWTPATPNAYAQQGQYLAFHFFGNERPSVLAGGGVEVLGSGGYLSKLSLSDTISSSSSWGLASKLEFFDTGPWNGSTGGVNYIGFRLTSGATDYNYGWVALSYNDAANTMTISEFAINSTLNQSITAGQTSAVPEPATSALLLAAGAAGLALYRRRKAAAAVVATS